LHYAQADLPHVGETRNGARLLSGLGKDRKEYRRENRDNSDHNEQFDERKAGTGIVPASGE
jgi:hypothetical protein